MEMQDDIESGSFATTVIRVTVPATVTQEALDTYLQGVGEACRSFEGFVSRKIVEIPQNKSRLLVIILKFEGDCASSAYENMTKWNESEDLELWRKQGRQLGLRDERSTGGGVGHIDLRSDQPPPKWKMACIIEFWVFISVVFNAAAGSRPRVGNEPFALLVSLAVVVVILVYAALPLTLSIQCISLWAHRRASNPSDTVAVLEDGFMLFTPDDAAKRLAERLDAVERKLDAALRKPSQAKIQAIKRDHEVQVRDSPGDEGGVTVAARHRIRWDALPAFQSWCDDMASTMRTFDPTGFLGSDVFRASNDTLDFVVIFRFATLEKMETWLDADERAHMLAKLEPLVDASSVYADVGSSLRLVATPNHRQRTQRDLLGALLFAEDAKNFHQRAPPLYKSCVLSTASLFLVAWPIGVLLGPKLLGLHPLLAILITTICTVLAQTYFAAPLAFFLFGTWLTRLPGPASASPTPFRHIAAFLVVGFKTNIARLVVLVIYFAALVVAAILKA